MRLFGLPLGLAFAAALAACGDNQQQPADAAIPVTIGGSVSGLAGSGLVLQNNGGDDLAITADGSFSFATQVLPGSSYSITVVAQPSSPAQTCTVANGTGVAPATGVSNVAVSCTTTAFTVGGTVTGLVGAGLVIQNNGGDDLAISADGTFEFATPVASGATFTVTVKTQPSSPTQTCAVVGGSGTVGNGDVSSVAINCSTNKYTIGGSISGLVGTGLVLQNNSGDDLSVTANGTFAFATPIDSGVAFAVTVKTQPSAPEQTCSVTMGTGTVVDSNVTTVSVLCTTNTYAVGGTVSGLAGSGLVLQDNLGDNLPISADGSFTFATPVASGASYSVTVLAQPSNVTQTCVVSNGAGTITTAAITNVSVTCTTNKYTISGTVTGLTGSGLVLQDNSSDDLPISADGSFTFAAQIDSGSSYAVTIASQPQNPWQTCTVSGGSGTVVAANVTTVMVNCTTNQYAIGGTVSGLAGSGLQVSLDGGAALPINANGTYSFPTLLDSGAGYTVTITAQPTSPWQTCTLSNATGTVAGAAVTNVDISCTTNSYNIGGSVSGLAGSGLVLQDNLGDDLAVSSDGTFTFPTAVTSGGAYSVSVKTQPTSPWQTCSVSSGAGTVAGADVTNVSVTCTTNSYVVSGTLSGLASTVTLQDNNGDDLVLTANGTFTFATPVASGDAYGVTVKTQPTNPWQTCTVANGAGTIAGSAITNVTVTCVTNQYSIGGTVMGLAGSGLALQDNNGDDLAISADGTFTFATPLDSGSTYDVTVQTQPTSPWQQCTVSGGAGTVGGANVTSVIVNCATDTYTVGGTVSGLAGATGLVLQDNLGDDLAISGDGTFAFATAVPSGGTYSVTVKTQPTSPWETCTVGSATGTVTNANIADVTVTCTANTYDLSVAVTGLAGSGLVLQNNGADNLSITGDGTFTFAAQVASGSTYNVTVLTQPSSPWQTCTVASPAGTMADGATLAVTCVTNNYTIGGTVGGLGLGNTVVLKDNGGDDLSVTTDGTFTFASALASGASYSVTVATQPSDRTCYVAAGSGTVTGSNVTTVNVTCTPIVNASFESNYAGWTVWATQSTGTLGTWGIATNGQTIAAGQSVFDYYTNQSIVEGSPGLPFTYTTTDGSKLSIAFQNGGEEHRLYQDVTVPGNATVLAWDMMYNNHASGFDPTSQYLALNIRNPSTDAILATPYKTTQNVDPLQVSMRTFTVDVIAFRGQTVRIDVDMMVNSFFFDAAFDTFRFQ